MNVDERQLAPRPARGPRAAALVAVIAFVSFLPALGAGFVYDDSLLIATNPAVQSWHGVLSAFTGHFWQTEDLGTLGIGLTYYRPVVTLSFVLNWLAFAGAAWGFHLVNLLLHAGAALLATRIALRWLGRPWLAVLVGVLFAVHPTRSESVIWIAGRTDILMTIFGLLSAELLHRARRDGGSSSACWGLVCLGLALLCKEGAAVLPVLLLADALRDEPSGLTRRTLRWLLGAAALCGAYLLVRSTILPVRYSHSAFLPAYGFMTVATYVERLFWPWPQTFFYRNLQRGPAGIEYPWGIVAAGVVLALGYLALTWRAYRRDRAAAACLVSALLLLAPVLNFFETGIYVSVSDHFLYLPLFLLLLAAARLFGARLARLPDRFFSLTTLLVVGICLVPNTLRARDFENERALWEHELAIDPDNPVALDWMSGELARAGQPREAAALLARASSAAAQRRFLLAGKNASAGRQVRRVVLTAAITADGDVEALRRFAEELESFERGSPSGHVSDVGGLTLGRDLGQSLTARTMNSRGRDALEAELGTLASRLGRDDEAKAWLRRVGRDHPEFLPNPLNLVLVQARVGDYAGAFATLDQLDHAKRSAVKLQHGVLESLARRVVQSRNYLLAAEKAPVERQAVLRALAALEVGSILPACRALRTQYLEHPERQDVAQLYAQALISARLDAEATRVVARALGPERAARVVASLKENLAPIQRALPAAPDSDAWWRPEPR
jgi:hypothetical protein